MKLSSTFLGSSLSTVLVVSTLSLSVAIAHAAGHHVTKHPIPGLPSTVSNALVYNVYWSLHWDTDSPNVTQSQIDGMTRQLLGSSYLGDAQQYGVNGAVLDGSYQDFHNRINCTPRYTTSTSKPGIVGYLGCNIANPQNHLPRPDGHKIYVLYLPPKTDISGNTGCSQFVGYHSFFPTIVWGTALYIVIPLKCNLRLSDISNTLSHEIAETMTDPVAAGWYEGPILSLSNEVGDLCENASNAAFYLNGLLVSTYWSNADNNCVAGNLGGLVVRDFSVSITGATATVTATILNSGGSPFVASKVGFGVPPRIIFLAKGFPAQSNVTILPGKSVSYTASSTFTTRGTSCFAMDIGQTAGITTWSNLPGQSAMPGACFTLDASQHLTQLPWHA